MRGHIPKRVLEGIGEPIFDVLPQRVLDNLRRSASENALVWNLIYPLARPRISLAALLALRPLWGTPSIAQKEDALDPHFWGYAISGRRLPGLDRVLQRIDGAGPQTEVDVFLVGEHNVVLVEAKNRSGMGRCARYQKGRCPETGEDGDRKQKSCRYWEIPGARFSDLMEMGLRPIHGGEPPPCSVHYQLARTLLVGMELAAEMDKLLHLWMIVPHTRWRNLQPAWQDFCDRLRDDILWRRLRVLAWEDVRNLR